MLHGTLGCVLASCGALCLGCGDGEQPGLLHLTSWHAGFVFSVFVTFFSLAFMAEYLLLELSVLQGWVVCFSIYCGLMLLQNTVKMRNLKSNMK